MMKIIATALVAATFYAGQADLIEQAFAALGTVQAQQAAAVAQIRQVQQGTAGLAGGPVAGDFRRGG